MWFGWIQRLWHLTFPDVQSVAYPRPKWMQLLRRILLFFWSIPALFIGAWFGVSYFPLVFMHLGTLYAQGGLPALADPAKLSQALQLDLLPPLLGSPPIIIGLIGLVVCIMVGLWARWDREQEQKAQEERSRQKGQDQILQQISQQGEARAQAETRIEQKINLIQEGAQSFQTHVEEPLHELAEEVKKIAQQRQHHLEASAAQLKDFCNHQVQRVLAGLKGNLESFSPYNPDVYLPRRGLTEAFQAWLTSDYPCFAVIGHSGMGKTSFICAAADTLLSANFVLFYRARHLPNGLQTAIVQDFAWEYGHEANFVQIIQGLDAAATDQSSYCVILLDGLDEFRGDLLRTELMELVPHLQGTRVRLCLSCTDTDWERFVVENGTTPTPLARLLFQPSLLGAAQPPGRSLRTSNGGIWLEPFDEVELEDVFAKYKVVFSLRGRLFGATREQCRYPLWLSLLATTYRGRDTELPSTLSNRRLFDMYWDRQLGDVRQRIATERILSCIAELCVESGQEEIELSQVVSDARMGGFSEEAYQDALRFGLIQVREDAHGYDQVSFSYPIIMSYTFTIKSQQWPRVSPADLARRMCILLEHTPGVKAVEFYLTTIDCGETEHGVNGPLTEIALQDFNSFVRLTADFELQSNLLDKTTDEERSSALLRRLEQYVRTYSALLDTHFPDLWQKVDPYIDLLVQFPRQRQFGEVGIWVSNSAFQLRARTQEYSAPLIILPQEIAGNYIQGRPPAEPLRNQLQAGGLIQIGFPQIEKHLPQKLAWEHLRSQIARLFINRILDESQTPILLAERCREDFLYHPSIWPEGCVEESERQEYIHQIGFSTASDLYSVTIDDLLARVDLLLSQYSQRAAQTSNGICQRWFDLEIKRLLRLTYALNLLRRHAERLDPPRFTLDEFFSYPRQGQLANYVHTIKTLLPDILNSYTALLQANFSHLADRFTFSKYAQQSMLVEVAHAQGGGFGHSDFLTVTYALLPSTTLPESQIVYANDGPDSLATLPIARQTLKGMSQVWGGRFGQAKVTKTIGNLHIDEPSALIYVTRFPSHHPILDQCYQLLGVEAEILFGGAFREWHQLDTGKIENADYDRWVITELGRG